MASQQPPIVFVHGLFQNPDSWAKWITFFSERGYGCHAPAYPFHEGRPADLRRSINPALGRLTFGQVIDHLRRFIDTLPEPPILVGHSMGGLVVQKLLQLGQGRMAVAIDSAPPPGIFSLKWSFLKANLSTVNPLKGNTVCLPSVEWFHYAFCHTMTIEETSREYERYVVPESRNIPRRSTGREGAIDFSQPHRPLLFIAGERDHIIPASLNVNNFKAYTDVGSHRTMKIFPNRTHYICGMTGWEEVAGYVAEWVRSLEPRA